MPENASQQWGLQEGLPLPAADDDLEVHQGDSGCGTVEAGDLPHEERLCRIAVR